ncbi:hypothetical protein [Myceligenerans indicum]|uniref:DUF4367 domain-containing protein n=1 Tax=Myceligenerans indicum TaxID=2593663 RepID=A0ABS1LNZ8_9MICO|nr:hypothetical protein [Myceligenerans indicum]MBL0887282.1 hypothetical protein [Myceligenerans indicum]
MNRTTELLQRIAPDAALDPAGLEVARASFDRARRQAGSAGARRRGPGVDALAPQRTVLTRGQVLALATAGVLLLGAVGTTAVLAGDHGLSSVTRLPGGGSSPSGTDDSVPSPSTAGTARAQDTAGEPDHWSTEDCAPTTQSLDTAPSVPEEEWPGKLDHAVMLPDVPIDARPTLQETEVRCLATAVRAVYVDVEGNRGLNLYRHQRAYTSPSPDREVPSVPDGGRRVELRGTEGSVWEQPEHGSVTMMWEEHGTAWTARAAGMTTDEVLAAVEALTISPEGAVSGPVPDGFEAVAQEVAPTDVVRLFTLHHPTYGPYLYVSWPPASPAARLARSAGDAQAVRMPDGSIAVYEPGLAAAGNPPRFFWEEDGAGYALSDAGASLPEMITRAGTIEHLAATDPRLTAPGLVETRP